MRSDEYVPDLGVSLEVSGCAALHPGQAGFVGKLLTAWIPSSWYLKFGQVLLSGTRSYSWVPRV